MSEREEPECVADARKGLDDGRYESCGGFGCRSHSWHLEELVNAYDALRSALTTAERERDEARRDVARLQEEAKERLEQWSGVYESARTRAERAERVAEAARKWKADQRGWLKPLDEDLRQAVEALDAAEEDAKES